MARKARTHIFFVDDEPKIRKVVAKTLKRLGPTVSCFSCADDCLKRLQHKKCDLLITDIRMPGTDGIGLLIKAKGIAPWLPVLVITGYGDIPMAVKALKAGATDFIEKPLDAQNFVSTVKSILEQNTPSDRLQGKALTKTEMKVLRLILNGMSNRKMASQLHRSIRTIESHRNRIMRKVDADSLVDLVKRAAVMGLIEPVQDNRYS
jgi:two-component system response regulator FixJ